MLEKLPGPIENLRFRPNIRQIRLSFDEILNICAILEEFFWIREALILAHNSMSKPERSQLSFLIEKLTPVEHS